ncbi:MAG: hypothetical protein J2P43_01500, partial [Candidatus Dormibacteraeota bacterium]|nr:hypothetical protein [Candidatus Dormibacteraeota bacterium]
PLGSLAHPPLFDARPYQLAGQSSPMGHPYGSRYRRIKAMMLGPGVPCAHCRRRLATTLDHDPPLGTHRHQGGTGCCRLIPSCESCNKSGGSMVADGTWRPGVELAGLEAEPERGGLPADDPRFDVPWLSELGDDAGGVWPRLMTVPHPDAADSLGAEFAAWAAQRAGRELRWWQRLVAARLLEVDGAGRLVWDTLVLSTARQVGKSWLLRELMLWRIHQGERFGEPQDVLHTGKDLAVCKEVQRPVRIWAKQRGDYHVREVNGQEEIELLADGSRWMVRAKDAVYGYSVSLAAVDEAWKVRAAAVDEGLTPTMVEREQPQLVLVSTAHRLGTKLMLERRQVALAALEEPDADLLIEWSAPETCELEDIDAWRQASPHWTMRRRDLIARRLEAMRSGDVQDPEEPDPEQSFRSQWLNQWPRKLQEPQGPTEPLLAAGVWEGLRDTPAAGVGPLYVGIEDDYGLGAAVAAVRRTEDGRLEVDGWLRADWDSAIADLEHLAGVAPIRTLRVGASLADRAPARAEPCTSTDTRTGLALLRDLALNGQLVHDVTSVQLDDTLALATVREAPSGLFLLAKGPTHLVRALVWALAAAHRPAPAPAVH